MNSTYIHHFTNLIGKKGVVFFDCGPLAKGNMEGTLMKFEGEEALEHGLGFDGPMLQLVTDSGLDLCCAYPWYKAWKNVTHDEKDGGVRLSGENEYGEIHWEFVPNE